MKLGKLDAALVAAGLESEALPISVPGEVAELGVRIHDFERIERVPVPS